MPILGVISDTHGLLREEAVTLLRGVDHIIHAGDIGDPEIVQQLRAIAPVSAIRGNIDAEDWALAYPETLRLTLFGHTIFVIHDLKALEAHPEEQGIRLVISGHSHRARIETRDSVIYLNPGSAGPRRFKLPISLATVEISGDLLRPIIHTIG
jgi:putative phosphoesterase